MTTATRPPKWELTAPSFPRGWSQAFNWAYHVARVGQCKTKVQKIDGQWRVWKQK